ncbi:hypothetical protein PITC_079620 [Penicillium italicum]|uniref:Uncharacterized protein n=1 Tax=Penicillium italicum TaxID=40296 RepID=A0A0A2KQG2_PENIT|nr:hypothetical protein PITC_079620 [Penicillium italicum]
MPPLDTPPILVQNFLTVYKSFVALQLNPFPSE